MSEPLYRKVGRRYEPVSSYEVMSGDSMTVGTFRLTYSYADGSRRYSYDVRPDTAGFVAAALIAGKAMEDAIIEASIAQPHAAARPYTKRQQALVEKFRADMAAAGAMVPQWWEHKPAHQIVQAGIDAVRNWKE